MKRSHAIATDPRLVPTPWPAFRQRAGSVIASAWSPRLALLFLLASLLWLGGLQLPTPAATPATAPATAFSAERALDHLRVIAAEPRPVGSPAHAAVRQHLLDQLRALGLEPQVQTTTSVVLSGPLTRGCSSSPTCTSSQYLGSAPRRVSAA